MYKYKQVCNYLMSWCSQEVNLKMSSILCHYTFRPYIHKVEIFCYMEICRYYMHRIQDYKN